MEATLITIGDEILIGQVVDTNSAWMGRELNLRGVKVKEIISISDTKDAIIKAIDEAFKHTDLILMTGGLGPTKDDITKKVIATYFDVGLEFHEPTYQWIVNLFKKLKRNPTEAHKEQCYMPINATLLDNRMGSAPGMWFDENGKVLISMPGVPYEMKSIMEQEVFPRLKERFVSKPIAHKTILTIGEGESRIASRIEEFENNLPEHIKLAYLPNLGMVRLRLSATGANEKDLNKQLSNKTEELKALIPELIFGYDNDTIQAAIGRLLINHEKTLCLAESCTGGYIAHMITKVSGASVYFMGGTIPYSNEMKEKILGVKKETLMAHGAVSEQTVVEMVNGSLDLMKTDIALAVSGIAGPGGGTTEKPVGTIWLAIGDKENVKTYKLQLGKDRLKNIEYTTIAALNTIRKFLLN